MTVTVEDLKQVFATVVPAQVLETMDPTRPMVGQGIDSLALTALAVAIQKTYGVTLGPKEGVKLKTLEDLVHFLNTPQA